MRERDKDKTLLYYWQAQVPVLRPRSRLRAWLCHYYRIIPNISLFCERVHVQEWEIIIQVLVTCSEAVNDWEISGDYPAYYGRDYSDQAPTKQREEDFKAPGHWQLVRQTADIKILCALPQQRWQDPCVDWRNSSFIRIINPLSKIGMREMRIFGELITDSEIFCLGWKISTFPKLLRTAQGGRPGSRCRQLTVDKGH